MKTSILEGFGADKGIFELSTWSLWVSLGPEGRPTYSLPSTTTGESQKKSKLGIIIDKNDLI